MSTPIGPNAHLRWWRVVLFAGLVAGGIGRAQDSWSLAQSPTTQALQGICWGGGQFVAVGESGTVLTSADGVTWQQRASGTGATLRAVTWGDGTFVAVGDRGTIVSSRDGVAWTPRVSGATHALTGIAHGEGRFLCVGSSATALSSADAVNWSAVGLNSAGALRATTHGFGQFLAVGDSGAICASPGARASVALLTQRPEHLHALTYARRQFLIVGERGYAYASGDGRTFRRAGSRPAIADASLHGVAFFNDSFVIVGDSGTLLTSQDAETWTRRPVPGGASNLRAVAAGAAAVVAVGENGTILRSAAAPRGPAIIVPPQSQTASDSGNDNVIFSVTAAGTAPLAYQWYHKGDAIAGATEDVLIVEQVRSEFGDYTVAVSNALGRVVSPPAELRFAWRANSGRGEPIVDATFLAIPRFETSPAAAVELRDGRILVGGDFTVSVGGETRHGLTLLSASGAQDPGARDLPTLNAGGRVHALVSQPDERVLVLGDFATVNGASHRNLVRLLADGSLDLTFAVTDTIAVPSHARLYPVSGGAILVVGAGDGTRLHRLKADGSLDATFRGEVQLGGRSAIIKNAVIDAAGGVLVACATPDGPTTVARLLPDGNQDRGFRAFELGREVDVPLLSLGDRDRVLVVRVSANGDGSVAFGSLGSDGTPDSETSWHLFSGDFRAAARGADGSIVIATSPRESATRAALSRFRPDARYDDTFNFSNRGDGPVSAVAVQRDGRVLVAGGFTEFDGVPRPHLARLRARNDIARAPAVIAGITPPRVQVRAGEPFTLKPRLSTAEFSVRWVDERGAHRGSYFAFAPIGPEEFAESAPGTYYFSVQVANSDRTTSYGPFVRVDVADQPTPIILAQPQLHTTALDRDAHFSVTAAGTHVTYQWLRDGQPIPGATARHYRPSSPPAWDSTYTVRVTNQQGSLISAPVPLPSPVAPTLTQQPTLSRTLPWSLPLDLSLPATTVVGSDVYIEAAAQGTPPLRYEWLRDGTPIPGATRAELRLRTVHAGDAGAYAVRVSNVGGSITSDEVLLSLAPATVLTNLSVRTSLARGGAPLTLGLTISAPASAGPKPLLLRGIGPSLSLFGVPGALEDPELAVLRGDTVVARNDNWSGDAQVRLASVGVGAFALPADDAKDAALIHPAAAGSYTIRIADTRGSPGGVLAEVYDMEPPTGALAASPRLINASVLTDVGPATGPAIAGFTLSGSWPRLIMIRAIGPALDAFGVPNALPDPRLELFRGGEATAFLSNDNWESAFAQVERTAASVGAFALPGASKDAVVLTVLAPGSYTAQVSSGDGRSGAVLVEIYEVP